MHDRPARPTAFCWNQKYPRVCGEKFRAYAMIWQEWGSPPHMRGKDLSDDVLGFDVGITPAYAGKSWRGCTAPCRCRDHPRVCGEKPAAHSSGPPLTGSPPRMRGKDGPFCAHAPFLRITPAYAGKSLLPLSCSFFMRDHPRVCGEKLFFLRFLVFLGRITPAYAGKSRL